MEKICREIFKAIHKGEWLSIEYQNKGGNQTKYWVAVKDVNVKKRQLTVDGCHLGDFRITELTIFIDSILSAAVVEGTVCNRNEQLIEDIERYPHKYAGIFSFAPNLKILNYLSDCNKLDTTPYKTDYALLSKLDEDSFVNGKCHLDDQQFQFIVKTFQYQTQSASAKLHIKQLCLNVLSVKTPKGLYVLAHRKLFLDVKMHMLTADEGITVNSENTVDGVKQSINYFLDADDCALLDDFEGNREIIKDRITANSRGYDVVDDLPHIIAMGYDVVVDLDSEYSAIEQMYYSNDSVATKPIDAFFGNNFKTSARRKELPVILRDNRINADQLLAVNNSLRYPLTYVQGPPGTGKTNTIINMILSAFFNDRTVLFASYNNHPIDGVYNALANLSYRGNTIPFPVLRLGNNEKVKEAAGIIKKLLQAVEGVKLYPKTLSKYRENQIERSRQLTELLDRYGKILQLNEKESAVEDMLSAIHNFSLSVELQAKQRPLLQKEKEKLGNIREEDIYSLLPDEPEELYRYLYYTSVRHIQLLREERYAELLKIVNEPDSDKLVADFNRYLTKEKNVVSLQRVFPVVITTCISAHKIGAPKQYFDTVIIDEASQCNVAVSLMPILRGNSLVLVGDPQQLNPVIVLDDRANRQLRKKYCVDDKYDYKENSIYKTFVSADAVSNEILLSHHYRCAPKIIQFCNRKYYNNKLKIDSASKESHPLMYVDVLSNETTLKNTSPVECGEIVKYVMAHPQQNIGVITPFVNQRKLINDELAQYGRKDVTCGTVHAFQGDEKDVILFSLALTKRTGKGTYDWLKNNKELINVAVSRAKDRLVLLASREELDRLHQPDGRDDIYELADYVMSDGESAVTGVNVDSRALGVKPYSTQTEEAFFQSLNHALDNVTINRRQCFVAKEVPVSHIFGEDFCRHDLFYTGRFDFVVYDKVTKEPLFAIELDGPEHYESERVEARDRQKDEICRQHNFQLVRVKNSYARRYHYIKNILLQFFSKT